MSYGIKSIRYENTARHILLQNENGPCPLLAVANVLLLQGTISLPVSAVRTGVATTDDVCNTLAIVAMDGNPNGNTSSNYHIDELMKFFPTLQYGMDVNPRFVSGPTGMEYTIGVNAFDLMKVGLLHGWLVDESDVTTRNVIGMKTYNELTQIIIAGNEAKDKMDILSQKIEKVEYQICLESASSGQDEKIGSELKSIGSTRELSIIQNKLKPTECDDSSQNIADISEELQILETNLLKTRQELAEESKTFTEYIIVNDFLLSSSHQLTFCGLRALHSHLGEGEMSVFFRNNHFTTMTKKHGILYLLVTDLGYKNVPEVVWEKLDDISGNTDFVDQDFVKTKPLVDAGTLSGRVLEHVRRGGVEEDYQLALALSQNENVTEKQERELIAAAKLASLRDRESAENGTIADLKKSPLSSNEATQSISHAASDRAVALRLQAQYEIDASLENARRRRNQPQGNSATLAKGNSGNNNGCLIS